ncbi:MAG: UbiA family prenyltransferase, partial [Planctomycetes bacterium]|nr:UbiA family prenyltransferase [Planctomycetota bacterium]
MSSRIEGTLRAYFRLIRLPLVPTAIADTWAGWFLGGGTMEARPLAGLAGFSACAYAFGMVFNDLCDLPNDRIEHPERPLPNGAVSRRAAGAMALTLLGVSMLAAWRLPSGARTVACALLGAIAGYDALLKRWAPAGTVGMGLCRTLNLLTGALAAATPFGPRPAACAAAIGLGLYITIVTSVSVREAVNPALGIWVRRGILLLIPLDAALCFAGTRNA